MKARIHIKKDSLYNSFQHDKKTIENTFIERKRKISSDINSSDFEFVSLQISKKKKKKKNYEIFSLLLGRKNFQNFHAQKERERNVIIITSHKKEAKGKKREKREAKVRNASVIGLCIFHAETFRRRSPKQKEEEMKRERERETNQGKSASWIWVKSGRRGIKRAEPKPRTCQEKLPRGDNSARSKRKQQEVDEERSMPRLRKLMN